MITVPPLFAADQPNGSIDIILYREDNTCFKTNSIDMHVYAYVSISDEYKNTWRRLKSGEKKMYNHLIVLLKNHVFR